MVPVIGEGTNHWSVVHVDDIADLYALALAAPAGSVYAGVIDVYPTAREVSEAVSRYIGRPGSLRNLSPAEAEQQMGPIAEAFALDQQISGARARRDLGWSPAHLDPLTELAEGS
ncbi:hypothetical protein [Actinacidiphila glaucinigra]|uniref:hypothetical protein n=1 Tax=Actinacidiphila glaucinigra TaxID=235986 RepID=UPI0037136919